MAPKGLLSLLFFVCLECVGGNNAEAQTSVTLEQIANAWRERREGTHSARFAWTETHAGDARDQSATDVTDVPTRVTFSFNRMMKRYAVDGPQWNMQLRKYLRGQHLRVNDQSESKIFDFFGENAGGRYQSYPVGGVQNLNNAWYVWDRHLRAMLLNYQTADPDNYLISPEEGMVDTHRCTMLNPRRQRHDETVPRTSYWVDPEQDFVIVRAVESIGSDTTFQLDISYAHDKTHGWVPAAWNAVSYAGKPLQVDEQFRAVVTEYEIGKPIPRSEFEFHFPEGTYVIDRKCELQYIVRWRGTTRIVTREEQNAGVPYEVLLRTDPGEAEVE